MNRVLALASALSVLAACSSPVGDWTGTVLFQADDGSEYVNEMTVEKDGTGDNTLYYLSEVYNEATERNEMMIFYIDFTTVWSKDGSLVTFDLECHLEGCDQLDLTMDCEMDSDGLGCDMTPDFYVDDAASLRFVRAE